VKRGNVKIRNINEKIIDDEIIYININHFTEGCSEEIKNILISKENLQHYVKTKY
jgi:hypothetical protein